MRHSVLRAPQFYVTAPQECPYLEKQIERKLFTALNGSDSQVLNNALSKQGFRRSQNVLYRPSCADCSACLSARIPVKHFSFTKSEKRVLKRNLSLNRNIKTPWATSEQFDLFKRYVEVRHDKGGMSGMDQAEFSSMIEESSVKTILCEYSIQNEQTETAVAVSLTDIIEDGLSMVYSFYEPKLAEQSLGKYMILDHINLTKEMNLEHLYLGYWVKGSAKMDYKSQYNPLEVFINGKWSQLDQEVVNQSTKISASSSHAERTTNTIFLPDSEV